MEIERRARRAERGCFIKCEHIIPQEPGGEYTRSLSPPCDGGQRGRTEAAHRLQGGAGESMAIARIVPGPSACQG